MRAGAWRAGVELAHVEASGRRIRASRCGRGSARSRRRLIRRSRRLPTPWPRSLTSRSAARECLCSCALASCCIPQRSCRCCIPQRSCRVPLYNTNAVCCSSPAMRMRTNAACDRPGACAGMIRKRWQRALMTRSRPTRSLLMMVRACMRACLPAYVHACACAMLSGCLVCVRACACACASCACVVEAVMLNTGAGRTHRRLLSDMDARAGT